MLTTPARGAPPSRARQPGRTGCCDPRQARDARADPDPRKPTQPEKAHDLLDELAENLEDLGGVLARLEVQARNGNHAKRRLAEIEHALSDVPTKSEG